MNQILPIFPQHGEKCIYLSEKIKTAVGDNKMKKESYKEYELKIKQFAK